MAGSAGGGGVVPGRGRGARRRTSRAKAKAEDKVNINEASKAELMKLAGVGPGGAQKIIDYREAHGPFKKAQDLEKVDGVGKGVIEKNAGRIAVK